MDYAVQVCFYVIGIPLELLAIAAVLRSGVRKYPLVFAYVIAVFLTTVVEMPTALDYYSGNRAARDAMISDYWRDEAILQVIIFATVISLIYAASAQLQAKRTVRRALLTGVLLFVGISFWVQYTPGVNLGIWMTPLIRDLKFCSAILDLALWALLIQAKEKDRILLAVSGGLGIMFAGGAIGEAIRNLATANKLHLLAVAGGLLVMLADLMLLFILWQVFRRQPVLNPKKSRP